MVHGFLELEEEFNLARQKIGEVERGSCARHHLLCPITWHPLQSISSHFSQHFLKKPHPSRAHRYLATASPGEGVRTTKRTKRRGKRRSGVTGRTRLGPNTGRRPRDHARAACAGVTFLPGVNLCQRCQSCLSCPSTHPSLAPPFSLSLPPAFLPAFDPFPVLRAAFVLPCSLLPSPPHPSPPPPLPPSSPPSLAPAAFPSGASSRAGPSASFPSGARAPAAPASASITVSTVGSTYYSLDSAATTQHRVDTEEKRGCQR